MGIGARITPVSPRLSAPPLTGRRLRPHGERQVDVALLPLPSCRAAVGLHQGNTTALILLYCCCCCYYYYYYYTAAATTTLSATPLASLGTHPPVLDQPISLSSLPPGWPAFCTLPIPFWSGRTLTKLPCWCPPRSTGSTSRVWRSG